jgi:hypothetical protein
MVLFSKGKTEMTLLTQTELNPLQEARRCAEEHLDRIRLITMSRASAHLRGHDAEAQRVSLLFDIVGALQTIYDAVSELEFEEEGEPEPVEEAANPFDDEEDEPAEDEDEDEDEDAEEED